MSPDGQHSRGPGSESLETALRFLHEAVARDPGFALAHTCLAHCYMLRGVFGVQAPLEVYPRAKAAARRALELDPLLGEAYAQSAHIEKAIEQFQRRRGTTYGSAADIAAAHALAGRRDEALAGLRRLPGPGADGLRTCL